MEISVVGREVVESWKRLEGWEAVVRMLDGCKRCVVRVNVREGDVRIQAGEDGGGDGGWLANGGNVGPLGWGTQGVGGSVELVNCRGRDGDVKGVDGGEFEGGRGLRVEHFLGLRFASCDVII